MWHAEFFGLFMSKKRAPLPDNAPLTAFEKARFLWFEQYGSAIVDRNRSKVAFILALLVICAQGVAIYQMLPLKTVVPYIVKVADNGSVVTSNAATANFVAGDKEISYFLVEWTKNLLTLDRQLTEHNLKSAMRRTSGVASSQLSEYVKKTQPFIALSETPDLVRTVDIITMPTNIADKVVMLRVETVSRTATQVLSPKRYQVTLRYALSPPQSEKDIMDNPIGLFITDFKLSEEMT